MEMHQLRYMVAVARAGNFSRAAEQCHVSQPSLSQQIQKLEQELGEQLFLRLRRQARLTPAGEAFLRRAERILQEVEAAKREAEEAQHLLRGTLTLGVLPTLAPYLLPPLVSRFQSQYPDVEMVVLEDTTGQLLKLSLSGDIDLALASLPITDNRFEVRELFAEELLVALPPKHPLTRKRLLRARDLEHERFIVMKEGHCLGDQVLHFCERRDVRPNITFRSAQLETIQALICAGMGLSLIPAMAAVRPGAGRQHPPVYKRLEPPRPQRTIVALWPRQRPLTRAASALLNQLTQLCPSPA